MNPTKTLRSSGRGSDSIGIEAALLSMGAHTTRLPKLSLIATDALGRRRVAFNGPEGLGVSLFGHRVLSSADRRRTLLATNRVPVLPSISISTRELTKLPKDVRLPLLVRATHSSGSDRDGLVAHNWDELLARAEEVSAKSRTGNVTLLPAIRGPRVRVIAYDKEAFNVARIGDVCEDPRIDSYLDDEIIREASKAALKCVPGLAYAIIEICPIGIFDALDAGAAQYVITDMNVVNDFDSLDRAGHRLGESLTRFICGIECDEAGVELDIPKDFIEASVKISGEKLSKDVSESFASSLRSFEVNLNRVSRTSASSLMLDVSGGPAQLADFSEAAVESTVAGWKAYRVSISPRGS